MRAAHGGVGRPAGPGGWFSLEDLQAPCSIVHALEACPDLDCSRQRLVRGGEFASLSFTLFSRGSGAINPFAPTRHREH